MFLNSKIHVFYICAVTQRGSRQLMSRCRVVRWGCTLGLRPLVALLMQFGLLLLHNISSISTANTTRSATFTRAFVCVWFVHHLLTEFCGLMVDGSGWICELASPSLSPPKCQTVQSMEWKLFEIVQSSGLLWTSSGWVGLDRHGGNHCREWESVLLLLSLCTEGKHWELVAIHSLLYGTTVQRKFHWWNSKTYE